MEKLLRMAKKICDKAEIYSIENECKSVAFENAKLYNIECTFERGISLRIIKNGKLGFAYTKNLLSREELITNAVDSLKGGVEANYDFPFTKEIPQLNTYEHSIENLAVEKVTEECVRVCDIIKAKTDGEIKLWPSTDIRKIRIINSEGTDISSKSTSYKVWGVIMYPGSASGIWRVFQGKKFENMPSEVIDEMIGLYNLPAGVIKSGSAKMKVLFMPNSMAALVWRILSGTSAQTIFEKKSPLINKVGKKIFSEKITILDDPLDDNQIGARPFDDDGTTCKSLSIIENGVLKNFYYDLHFANEMKGRSTGHGYKGGVRRGDPIVFRPEPQLCDMKMATGKTSFTQMVKSIDRGIILDHVLGLQSGNIPGGDFSVGVNPGWLVEKGEVVGRVKDTMISGNIYKTLQNVIAIGDKSYPTYWRTFLGFVPAILCDDVSVSAASK